MVFWRLLLAATGSGGNEDSSNGALLEEEPESTLANIPNDPPIGSISLVSLWSESAWDLDEVARGT